MHTFFSFVIIFHLPYIEKVKVKVKLKSLSCVRLFATPWTVAYQTPLSLGFFPGKNTGMGCHFLLQEIFPTQRLNLGLAHCKQTLYDLSYRESRKAAAILLRNQTGFKSDFIISEIKMCLRLIFAWETLSRGHICILLKYKNRFKTAIKMGST